MRDFISSTGPLFTVTFLEIDIPVAQSTAVSTINAALEAAEQIGYPVILRSAFTLGGLGSGFANNPDELRDLSAKSLSLSPQVLIERSMKGWKELEYEVVRDAADVNIFCCLHTLYLHHIFVEHYHLLQYGELRPSRNTYWRFHCRCTFTDVAR